MSAGIPCPRCRAPLRLGASTCLACGSAAIAEKKEEEEAATCAAHPLRLASAACLRCGVFGCATCLVRAPQGVICRACRPPARVPPAIAWEDPERKLPVRFLATAWDFFFHPMRSARAVQSGSVLKAWSFAAICVVLHLTGFELAMRTLELSLAADLIVVSSILVVMMWLLLLPFGEYALLRIFGAKVPLDAQLRASAYSSAVLAVPFCACLLFAVWAPVVRLLTLRSAFGLPWLHALVASTTVPLVGVCAIIGFRLDLFFWV